MNRLNLTNQGFVGKTQEELQTQYEKNIFRTWEIQSQNEVKIVNAHTGTSLGIAQQDNQLLASVRWQEEQPEIELALTIVGLTEYGEVIPFGPTGKLVAFLLFRNNEWHSLSYNIYSDTYEFLVTTLNEIELPKKLDDSSAFYIDQIIPKGTLNEELKFGDLVVLKNKKTTHYFSKSQYDGCSIEDYPIFKDHPISEFPSELVTGFTHGSGPLFCKSAECEDLSDDNKKYGRHAGCTMLFWQILPISTDLVDPNLKSASINTVKAKLQHTSDPNLLFWAFVPAFFLIVILMLMFLYYYF